MATQRWSKSSLRAGLLLLGLILAAVALVSAGPWPASAAPDLAVTVTKAAAPTRVVHGGAVDFTITFANNGAEAVSLDVITDTLDAGLEYDAMLAGDVTAEPDVDGQELAWGGPFNVGAGATLTVKYRAGTTTTAGWHVLCNRAEALAGATGIGPAAACVEVGPQKAWLYLPVIKRDYEPARFTALKTASPAAISDQPGQVVTYTITFANAGDEWGTVASVADDLPAGFTFLSMAAGSDITTNPAGTSGTITWNGPWVMNPGQQLRLIFRATPVQTPGEYWNSARLNVSRGTPPAIIATAMVTVQPTILLDENFDAGIARWTPFLNYHRLQPGQWYWGQYDGVGGSGALTHDCCTGTEVAGDAVMMYLQPGAEQWTDYRVETKMYLTGGVTNRGDPEPNSGDPIGLWVRGQWEPGIVAGDGKWISGYYIIVCGKSDSQNHWVRLSQMRQPGDCGDACREQGQFQFNNPMILVESPLIPGPFEHYRWYSLVVEVRGNNIKAWLDGQLAIDYTDTVLPFLTGTVGYKVHETKTASFDDLKVTPLH